jgi:tetratricopeptide (TPR) repeat protein
MKRVCMGRGFLIIALFLTSTVLPAQVDDASRILEQNKAGVLYLLGLGNNKEEVSRGTGFAVSEDTLVTDYHVVARATSMEAYTADNKRIRVEGILGVNKAANLAMIKVRGRHQSLIIGNFDIVAPGMRLFAIGANEAGEINIAAAQARQILQPTPELKVADFETSLPLTFSGAPVVDISGQVVGVLTVLDRGLKFIVPVNIFRFMTRLAAPVALKSWTHEDFYTTLEGSIQAGRIGAAIGDTGNAQRFLEQVLKLSPGNVEAQALLAKVYTDQRDYVAATAAYKRLIELDPNRGSAYFEQGVVLARTQKYDEALDSLNRARELDFNSPEVFFQMGIVYEAKKDFVNAVDEYAKYLLTLPADPVPAQVRLGMCAMETGQYDRAAAAFQEALKGQPRDYQTNYNLAVAYQKSKQYDKAEEVLKRLIQFYPEDAVSYYSTILRMYDEAGMNDKAIDAARKVMELDPSNHIAVYNLGVMYQKLKRYDEALATFQQALAIKPDFENAWYNIGRCASDQKKYREAIDAFKKFCEIVPDSAEGWLNVGVSYMYLKDFAGAVDPLQKCIALRPDYGAALYNLGISYINLKAHDSARETYQKLVGVDPTLASQLRKYLR